MTTAVEAARANLFAIVANPTKSTFAQKIRVSSAKGALGVAYRDELFADPNTERLDDDEIRARVEAFMEAEVAAARTAASAN